MTILILGLLVGFLVGVLIMFVLTVSSEKYLKRIMSRVVRPMALHEKYLGSLAVPDTEPWWIAVNYILDCAEAETVRQSRQSTMNTNMVLNAVGAGEGIALVRTKLSEAREQALKGYQNAAGNQGR